jgi:hypothetical protein
MPYFFCGKKVLDRRAAVQEIAYHFDLVHLCHGLDDPLNNEGLELGKSTENLGFNKGNIWAYDIF